MSRTGAQYPLTRFTSSGELTLECSSLSEHGLCYKRVSLKAWKNWKAALPKVLLFLYQWVELDRKGKRGLALCERVVNYIAPELISMVQLEQNKLICSKNEFINLKKFWCKEAPSGKGLQKVTL